jgi:hypothetical protein
MHKAPPPEGERCWLALTIDGATATVLTQAGPVVLSEAMPGASLLRGGQAWIPGALRDRLAYCREIAVVAPAALHGRPGLLPSEWAWAYADPRARPRPGPGTSRVRLVVADVPTPPALALEPLARWTPRQLPGDQLFLRGGPDATPSEILRRLPEADQIDFHVHGQLDPSISAVPYLVLAPDPDGRYALTAEAVRKVSLQRRAPVVLLAACGAARKGGGVRAGWSLPRAFLEAGARAVIAAPIDIPDGEAGAFFEEISVALGRTASAAAAVREARQARRARLPPASLAVAEKRRAWFEEIVVFEG